MEKKYISKMLIPIIALLLCGIVVLLERYGITDKSIETGNVLNTDVLTFTETVETEKECLILLNKEDDVSIIFSEMMQKVLDDMRIGYDLFEITEGSDLSCMKKYNTAVITFEDWNVFGEQVLFLCDWVAAGGRLMNTITPLPNEGFLSIAGKLGIEYGADTYAGITGFQMMNHCMIGAEEGEIFYYNEDDPAEELVTSLSVGLDEKCEVYMVSEDGRVPLLWKRDYKDGCFVMINNVITEKYQRGFLALSYSLLEEVCIYPVINASAFYLDDFPSPVPSGNGEYIKRDYGVSISSFYSSIWWPKVLGWAEKYDIRYTGLIIEEYSDQVSGVFERNTSVTQFLSYGNMLLNNGGELGYHGYNHMPLCLEGVDEDRQFGDYNLWKSKEDMQAALTELASFSKELFPNGTFAVYVPPSNILSERGKEILLETCPEIKVIASTYLKDIEGKVYEQEFEANEDGVIETPRITSGCAIGEYQKITALSELNYHYVQSHFMHPDDILDEDRGAAEGWESLSSQFETYLDWVYTSAPNIRNVNGSEMGLAVLQYDKLSLHRELDDNVLTVKIGGFSEEAHFLMRVNEGSYVRAEGAACEQVTGDLYAVHASSDEIKIFLGE